MIIWNNKHNKHINIVAYLMENVEWESGEK